MATELLDENADPLSQYLKRPEKAAPANTKVPVNVNADIENINPDLKERIAALNADWMNNKELNPKGIPLPITSGRRTREQQAREFQARKSGSKTTGFMAVDPDKYPDREYFHENAIDILPGILPDSYLDKFGLHRPFGKRDPVHVEINPKKEYAKPNQDITVPDDQNVDPTAMYLNRQGVVTAPTAAVVAPEAKGQLGGVKKEMQNQFANVKNELIAAKDTLSNPDYYTNQLPKQTAALADTAIGTVGGLVNFVGTPIARLFEATASEAKPKTVAGKAIFGESVRVPTPKELLDKTTQLFDKPIGKAFGITNDPMYNAEPSQRLMNFVSKNIEKGADAISKETGMSKADAEWFINAAAIKAAPVAANLTKKVYQGGKQTLQSSFDALKSKKETPINETPAENLKRNFDELKQRDESQRQAAAEGRPMETPTTENVATGSAKPTTPDAPFTEIKYAENGLPIDEQFARAQTLNRVLGSDHKADLAAIEGKGKERATNYATSNTDTAIGNFLKEKFAEEQKRLADYAEQQVKNTGGTVGLDESSVYKRGNTILKPLQDLENHFDTAISKVYKDRDNLAKDIPVEAQNIANILNDESLTLANTETIGLTNIAKARMKQLKMMDKDGNLLPTDAKTAENFRKFINENWDSKNANLHRQLKDAVDADVLANIDQSTPFYKEARDLVTLRKNTLDNPNGISRILKAEGPNKINRRVDIEKIAQNIADMPVDQMTHVIETLRNVPESLQPQAGAALAEIKAQFANNLADKKTPKKVNDFMKSNSEVMNRLFTPEEMNNFRDYHNAVHILATDTGYKGAAVQKINVEQKLGSKIKEHLITKGGAVAAETVTGGTGMGIPALVTHEILSGRAATKRAKAEAMAEQKALENTQQRFVDIQDLIK
jgi:hypothetical protein